MGLYLRKGIRVGPLRFNLSKSGVGVSAGIRGLRVGSGPRGNYVQMGRQGVYYRATLGGHGRNTPRHAAVPTLQPIPTKPLSEPMPIDADAAAMVDSSSTDLLAEINTKRRMWRLWPWGLVLTFVAMGLVSNDANAPSRSNGPLPVVVLLTGMVLTWLAHRRDVLRKTTVLMYDIENEPNQRYQTLHDSFEELAKCGGRWSVAPPLSTSDQKHHGGATHLLQRRAVPVSFHQPPSVQTNIEVPSLQGRSGVLYFFPDRLMVFTASSVGAVNYDGLKATATAQRYIESERVPNDAKVVGQTFKYVNKTGGPDKRFKDNRQIPIVQYDELHLESGSGLNEVFQVSRVGVSEVVCRALASLRPDLLKAEPHSSGGRPLDGPT
jgi:hypothetical protein